MAATPSVIIEKTIPWRGGTRTYTNRYHFNGGTPSDNAHWITLFDNIVTAEKAMHSASATITAARGYAAGSDVPVASKSYATVGTCVTTGGQWVPGEVAGLVRYSTPARTSKNHPIYLFNYYHLVFAISTTGDLWLVTQKTAANTYGAAWVAGFSDGTNTYVRAGPNGVTAGAALAETNLTHRDFPR
jgi:hypothetical protein